MKTTPTNPLTWNMNVPKSNRYTKEKMDISITKLKNTNLRKIKALGIFEK